MEACIAVLEEIARTTREMLARLDIRLDRIEADIKDVRDKQERDFRLLFGALIAATIGLAALMAHGFKWF